MKNLHEQSFKPSVEAERKEIECETEIYPIIKNTQLQQRYDRIATKWNSDIYEGTRRDDLIPELIKTADIKEGHKVLETMYGTALLSKEILHSFPSCSFYALDFSRGMLNLVPSGILEKSNYQLSRCPLLMKVLIVFFYVPLCMICPRDCNSKRCKK